MGSGASRREPDTIAFSAGKSKEYDDDVKEVWLTDEMSVLVGRFGGKFFATGSKCTHYGAPLVKGVFINGRVKCPWHGACFDVRTGDIEDFPGLDCLPTYQVEKKSGEVFVYVNPKNFVNKVVRPLSKMKDEYERCVIFGTGPSGYMCAQTLRQEGYVGKITMITKDSHLPYDRPKLSKALGSEWNDIKLRDKKFYDECDIDILLNTTLAKLDLLEHKLYLGSDLLHEFMTYDKIVLACGLLPRKYSDSMPGYNLKNIVQCSTYEDSMYIHKMIPGKDIVIVGGSFVAMELASSIKDKVKSVHILSRSDVPFNQVFGAKVGAALLKYYLSKAKNATFYKGHVVKSFEGNANGEVTAVISSKNTRIPCDLVIVAVGGMPNTQIFEQDSIKIHGKTNAIIVNKHMRTSYPNTWAVGDVVNFPIKIGAKTHATIGHWQVALTHGKVAALSILERDVSITQLVPFFWTSVCGVNIRYTGYGENYDESSIYGSLDKMEFCVVYFKYKKVIAFLAVGCDPLATEMAAAFELQDKWKTPIPAFIEERFPDPPVVGEVSHTYKPVDVTMVDFDLRHLGLTPEKPRKIKKVLPEKKKLAPRIIHLKLPNRAAGLRKIVLSRQVKMEVAEYTFDTKLAEAMRAIRDYDRYERGRGRVLARLTGRAAMDPDTPNYSELERPTLIAGNRRDSTTARVQSRSEPLIKDFTKKIQRKSAVTVSTNPPDEKQKKEKGKKLDSKDNSANYSKLKRGETIALNKSDGTTEMVQSRSEDQANDITKKVQGNTAVALPDQEQKQTNDKESDSEDQLKVSKSSLRRRHKKGKDRKSVRFGVDSDEDK